MPHYAWRGIETPSLERLRLQLDAGVRAASHVDSAIGRFSYEMTLDDDWTFRMLLVEGVDDGQQLRLESDGRGGWAVDGEPRDDLAEAIDIDLAVTPFTNTLPIRRLELGVDDEAALVMAYVSFPEFDVFADTQRYTRLDEGTYRYESLDSDFVRDITVDRDGLVLEYPGLFERI